MILFGASGHAKVIIDILEKQGVTIDYLVDANSEIKELQSYEVIFEANVHLKNTDEVIVSIGANALRKKVVEKLDSKFGLAIHPSTNLAKDLKVGVGTVIMAGVCLNSATKIGNHCIINTSASIDHDCLIDDYVHISPNATLCGNVTVGKGTHIGAGATIIPNLTIGKWATVGAGAVIIEDVPDYAVVVGNPGKVIRVDEQ